MAYLSMDDLEPLSARADPVEEADVGLVEFVSSDDGLGLDVRKGLRKFGDVHARAFQAAAKAARVHAKGAKKAAGAVVKAHADVARAVGSHAQQVARAHERAADWAMNDAAPPAPAIVGAKSAGVGLALVGLGLVIGWCAYGRGAE